MSFNPMGDNSRWALILTGQVQPTPEEARILAILKQLGGDAYGAANTPLAPAANHQPTDMYGINALPGSTLAGMQESGGKLLGAGAAGLSSLDRAVGSGMPSQSFASGVSDYVKRLQDVGSQAYGSALSSGPNASASQDRDMLKREGPASLSAGDYQQMATSTPMNQDAVSANPEDAYAQAFKAASASGMAPASGGLSDQRRGEQTAGGPVPTGVGSLGGGGGATGPTGAVAGSSAAYPDETNRGLARTSSLGGSGSLSGPSKAETDYTLEYDKAKDTGGDFLSRRRQLGQEYESEPDTWVRDLMASKGRSTQWDPYNARWAETWQSRMPLLLDFYVMGRGGDPYNPDDRTKALEEFGPQIISGNVNPSMVIQKALDAARGDERVMNMLVAEGPERIMQMRQLASGQSNRVSEALNTSLRRKVDEERRRQIAQLGSQDTDRRRYVDIASGKG